MHLIFGPKFRYLSQGPLLVVFRTICQYACNSIYETIRLMTSKINYRYFYEVYSLTRVPFPTRGKI